MWHKAVLRNFSEPQDVEIYGKPMLAQTTGLERADFLSIRHIQQALDSLQSLKRPGDQQIFCELSSSSEQHYRALVGLALKVKTRKQ